MNPNTILGQAIAVGLLLIVLAVLDRAAVSVGLAVTGLGWWAFVNFAYGRALDRRAAAVPSRSGRTQRRAQGDRNVARQMLFAYVGPLVVAVVCLSVGLGVSPDLGAFRHHLLQGMVATVTAMLVVWVASSQVDWYYVRPRLDGVVDDPPCRTSRDTRWKGVTRIWYIHRCVASASAIVALVVVVVLLVLVLDDVAPSSLSALGGFAAIFGGVKLIMSRELAAASFMANAIRDPPYWLGDDVSYDTDRWRRRGYVLHVAIPVTKLVVMDRDSGDLEVPREYLQEATGEFHGVRIKHRAFTGCASGCQHMSPECVHDAARTVSRRTPVLVL